jgi:hypothetical protein
VICSHLLAIICAILEFTPKGRAAFRIFMDVSFFMFSAENDASSVQAWNASSFPIYLGAYTGNIRRIAFSHKDEDVSELAKLART